jgi:hypothetical protein
MPETPSGCQPMGSDFGGHFGSNRPGKDGYWYLIDFHWTAGDWRYKTIQETPGVLFVKDISGEHKLLTRVEVSDSRETLGIIISPDGNMNGQFEKLLKLAKEWVKMMQEGYLSGSNMWTALQSSIWRTMAYSLPAKTMSKLQWEIIMSTLLNFALPVMGICRHFPRDNVFAPRKYFGLGIKHLHMLQETTCLKDIIYHTHNQTNTGKLYLTSMELLHIELGFTAPLHTKSFSTFSLLLSDSLLKSSWEFLDSHQIQLQTSPRQAVCIIMEEIATFTSDWQHLQSSNKCRLYLSAIFLSDITDGSGHFLLDAAWTGSQRLNDHRQSSWPNQGKPSELDWDTWRSLLRNTVLTWGRKLRNPLGNWIGMDPDWQWYYCPDDNRLYQKLSQG